MTFFIRDKKNNTIFEAEYWKKTEDGHSYLELSCSIVVRTYSMFLINNMDQKMNIITDFDYLSELRGWMWEQYFMIKKNDGNDEDYVELLQTFRKMISDVAKKYDLYYTED